MNFQPDARSGAHRLWRNVPNAISLARLCATPVLLEAIVAGNQNRFKWLLLGCLLSDILDGFIARVFDARSRLGAFLDSTADMIVAFLGFIGMYVFRADIVAAHWPALAMVLALYLVEAAAALWRYGRISSFHTIMVRVAAYMQGIFVMSLFLWGYVGWILYTMTAVSVLAHMEELVLLYLLPEWKADVPGIYWILSKKSLAAGS